jgi:phosphinothricin acetyltransferase
MNLPKTHDDVRLIDCNEAEHAAAILEILNDAIVNSTALYDYRPRPPEAMVTWFATKRAAVFRWSARSTIRARCSASRAGARSARFRRSSTRSNTVCTCIAIYRGRGLGELLLRELIKRARDAEVHVLVGCIDATNAGSVALHTRVGFVHSGTIAEAGSSSGAGSTRRFIS